GGGGFIVVATANVGDPVGGLRVSGTVRANAADNQDTCPAAPCSGRKGGQIRFLGFGGDIAVDATIEAPAGASLDAVGGAGGSFSITAFNGFSVATATSYPAGSIALSGDINVRGGQGAAGGGAGGMVEVHVKPDPDQLGSIFRGALARQQG